MAALEKSRMSASTGRFHRDLTEAISTDIRNKAKGGFVCPCLRLLTLTLNHVPLFDLDGWQFVVTIVQENRFVFSSIQVRYL